MVRHSVFRWPMALLALGWVWPNAVGSIASASTVAPMGTAVSPLFVTGNAQVDLPSTSSSVKTMRSSGLRRARSFWARSRETAVRSTSLAGSMALSWVAN